MNEYDMIVESRNAWSDRAKDLECALINLLRVTNGHTSVELTRARREAIEVIAEPNSLPHIAVEVRA